MKRTPLKRKTQIRKAHPETAKNLRAYAVFRKYYLINNPYCGFTPCFSISEDIHHKAGRGYRGSLLTQESLLMPICRRHHEWIHSHAKEARTKGLLLK